MNKTIYLGKKIIKKKKKNVKMVYPGDRWLYELSLKQEVDGNIFGGLQGEKSTDLTSL